MWTYNCLTCSELITISGNGFRVATMGNLHSSDHCPACGAIFCYGCDFKNDDDGDDDSPSQSPKPKLRSIPIQEKYPY